MTPADFFGYQIDEVGQLFLPGLTQEETLEYEMLSRQDCGRLDRSSAMRELELLLKQHRTTAVSHSDIAQPPRRPHHRSPPSPVRNLRRERFIQRADITTEFISPRLLSG